MAKKPVAKQKTTDTPAFSETDMITASAAAALLGVTTQWLRMLAANGYVPKAVRGKYPIVAVVQGYVKSLKDDDKRSNKSSSENRVRDARAAEIERRIAREDRKLIVLDEALTAFDEATGHFLQSLSGLPAAITRNLNERRRIETICDAERSRLSVSFSQIASSLETGIDPLEADDEDDA
ncbi:hypothetical protein WKW50_05475 [Ochrobactrum sp. GPK 3]